MAVNLSMPVVVVDDYSTMTRIIRNLLKQIGFEDLDESPDGASALAKMRARKYGLVISDWNMQPMSGYDLLQQVRADPALDEIPFIMITAESRIENVIAARTVGGSNYIIIQRSGLAPENPGGVPGSDAAPASGLTIRAI